MFDSLDNIEVAVMDSHDPLGSEEFSKLLKSLRLYKEFASPNGCRVIQLTHRVVQPPAGDQRRSRSHFLHSTIYTRLHSHAGYCQVPWGKLSALNRITARYFDTWPPSSFSLKKVEDNGDFSIIVLEDVNTWEEPILPFDLDKAHAFEATFHHERCTWTLKRLGPIE